MSGKHPIKKGKVPDETSAYEIKEEITKYQAPIQMNVRMAKDRFSHVVELASQGNEVIITSDGVPKAKVIPYVKVRKPYVPNWELIKEWGTAKGRTGAEIIREDRDSRG